MVWVNLSLDIIVKTRKVLQMEISSGRLYTNFGRNAINLTGSIPARGPIVEFFAVAPG